MAATFFVVYLVLYASYPIMTALYNMSIDSDAPHTYILVAASVMALASMLNFSLYLKKDKFKKMEEEEEEEEEANK